METSETSLYNQEKEGKYGVLMRVLRQGKIRRLGLRQELVSSSYHSHSRLLSAAINDSEKFPQSRVITEYTDELWDFEPFIGPGTEGNR